MARLFDDANPDWLNVDTAALNGFDITMSAWVYVDDLTINTTVLGVYDASEADNWFRLAIIGVDANQLRCQVLRETGSNVNADTSTGLSTNTWHHVFGTIDRSGGTISGTALLDGGSKGTDSQTATVSEAQWDRTRIGYTGDSSATQPMSGRIAECAIWQAQLSDAEAALLAKGSSPLFFQPEFLKFYAPLISDEDFDKVGGLSFVEGGSPAVAEHPPIIYPAPNFYIMAPPVSAVSDVPGWNFRKTRQNLLLRL